MKHNVTVFGVDGHPPDQPLPATLEWVFDHALVEVSGKPSMRLPLSGLELQLGGAEKNQIILCSRHPKGVRVYLGPDAERGLDDIAHPALYPMKDRIREMRLGRFTSRWKYRVRFGLTLAGGSIALFIAYRVLLFSAANLMPVAWEKKLGHYLGKGFEMQAVQDAFVQDQIERLGKQVAGSETLLRYDFRFRVVPKKTVNAFAVPGGSIYVHTGLIEAAETPEELAGVLAHEIQHVLERHSLHQIVNKYGFSLLLDALLSGSRAAELLSDLSDLQFSRSQEKEADLGGLELLRKAQLGGSGMVRFFERTGTSSQQGWLQYFSTHPADQNRALYLKEALKTLPPTTRAPAIHWEDFKRRCKSFQPPATK